MRLIAILFTLFLFAGFAPIEEEKMLQCSSSVSQTTQWDANQASGTIEVSVVTTGAYHLSLWVVENGDYAMLKKLNNTSGSSQTFDGLDKGTYKVQVQFLEEENALCQNRQIGGITF